MTSEILKILVIANLAAAAACLLVLVVRLPVRRLFGAGAAYALWAAVPIAMAATLLPPRTLTSAPAVIAQAAPAVETLIADIEAVPLPPSILQAPAQAGPSAPVIDVSEILIVLWAAGALAALILVALGQRYAMARFGRLTRDRSGARLWRASNPAVGPALVGLFRPKVIVPSDFHERFEARERAVILAHECAHLAAGHLWCNALAVLIRCINWFNPLIHYAAVVARADQELACDATVLARHPGERRTYADALLKSQITLAAPPLGCAWPHRGPQALKVRLRMLAWRIPGLTRRLIGAGAVLIVAAGAGVASWAAQPSAASLSAASTAPGPGGVLLQSPYAPPAPAGEPSPLSAPAVIVPTQPPPPSAVAQPAAPPPTGINLRQPRTTSDVITFMHVPSRLDLRTRRVITEPLAGHALELSGTVRALDGRQAPIDWRDTSGLGSVRISHQQTGVLVVFGDPLVPGAPAPQAVPSPVFQILINAPPPPTFGPGERPGTKEQLLSPGETATLRLPDGRAVTLTLAQRPYNEAERAAAVMAAAAEAQSQAEAEYRASGAYQRDLAAGVAAATASAAKLPALKGAAE